MRVTALYASLLAIWFFVLSLRVMLARVGPTGPSLGDGGNPMILRRIRAQANFAEYVPLVLLLLSIIESNGYPQWLIHILGGILLAGRLSHGYALSFTSDHVFGRTAGILLTLLTLVGTASVTFYLALQRA